MKVQTNGNDVRMFVIQPLYERTNKQVMEKGHKAKDEFGTNLKITEDKFIKEIYLKLWFDKRDLTPYGQYVGSKGEIVKNRSKIYCKSTQNFYTVAHSLEELQTALQTRSPINIGFAKRPTDDIQ